MTSPEQARQQLQEALVMVERELRRVGLWQSEPPPAEAFENDKPFCVDTMTFPQWLQFVMMERLEQLLHKGASMPAYCDTAPMAEEYFKAEGIEARALIEAVRELDRLVTASH